MKIPESESKPNVKGESRLTRHQLRAIERLQKEADALHRQLCGKFVSFFLNDDDPYGIDVQDKIKELSAKWKQYCYRNQIKPEFHNSVQDFCNKYVEEFKAEKAKLP